MVKTRDEWVEFIRGLISAADSSLDTAVGPILDAFINPSAVVFADFDFELDRVRKIINIDNYDLMTDEEFEAILGNYLIFSLDGTGSSGVVYFQASSLTFDIQIPRGFPVATDIRSGPQKIFYTVEQVEMLVAQAPAYFNSETGLYEVAATVQASQPGDIGSIPPSSITIMLRGISGIDRVVNKSDFVRGRDAESREDSVDRLKSFLKSSAKLSLKDGILFKVLDYVDDAVVVTSADDNFTRDSEDSGAVDVFIIGQEIASISEFFRVGYSYLEDPPNGVVWYFDTQPVLELVQVTIDSVDRTSWFSIQEDTGVYSGSVRGRDALYISNPSLLTAEFGKSVEVEFQYNNLIPTLQTILIPEDERVPGRDLLVREASQTDAVISMVLTYVSGFDQTSVKNTVKQETIDYINDLNIAENLEQADIIFIVRGVPGVDNVTFTQFRRESETPGTIQDLVAGASEYFRTSASLVTVT